MTHPNPKLAKAVLWPKWERERGGWGERDSVYVCVSERESKT